MAISIKYCEIFDIERTILNIVSPFLFCFSQRKYEYFIIATQIKYFMFVADEKDSILITRKTTNNSKSIYLRFEKIKKFLYPYEIVAAVFHFALIM